MPRFELDDREVTEAEFRARLAELHGQEQWTCAKTNAGGFVQYVARDAEGAAYHVTESATEGIPSCIARVPPPGPPRTYEVEGRPVSHGEFLGRLRRLRGKAGWSCAETSDGGVVRYVARDWLFRAYQVVESSTAGLPSSIRRRR